MKYTARPTRCQARASGISDSGQQVSLDTFQRIGRLVDLGEQLRIGHALDRIVGDFPPIIVFGLVDGLDEGRFSLETVGDRLRSDIIDP